MNVVFYVSAAIAILSTALAITRVNAVHALLYLIVSLLSVALVFFVIGAPFIAALEVIIYAGAIMVLFIFVVMVLNLGEKAAEQERQWLSGGIWIWPSMLSLILLGELIYIFGRGGVEISEIHNVGPKEVGVALFGPYVLAVELASMLLLAGLIGAYHLGRRDKAAVKEGENA
ncbi:MAG: NADH-quinone oxidoreductase subunit J [Deltaproteobacteria bacterium]|nr:NADH-quinone oxidoreductase subunit J [Deltaproteobacteria bacterium]